MKPAPLVAASRRGVISAARERSARFVVVLLLRHSGLAAAEFSENRDQLFAGIVEPIDTYAVVGVGVFRDLEHIGPKTAVEAESQSRAAYVG